MDTICHFGLGKQDASECMMIYIHWPGYYPTEESYDDAVLRLCPNCDRVFYLYSMRCHKCQTILNVKWCEDTQDMDVIWGSVCLALIGSFGGLGTAALCGVIVLVNKYRPQRRSRNVS